MLQIVSQLVMLKTATQDVKHHSRNETHMSKCMKHTTLTTALQQFISVNHRKASQAENVFDWRYVRPLQVIENNGG